jgi:hypothetical protein
MADALLDFQGPADLAAHTTSGVSTAEIPKRFAYVI